MPAGRFSATDDEAQRRFDNFHDLDPYPAIASALLNSADISDYVAATGMIHPFVEDQKHLKTASYQVPLLGRYVYWDENGEEVSDIIQRGDEFILKRNSIAFVTLEPMFRVPNYVAIRFNLKITNIYRGILLGTGPLVDPGYVGHLSLPLHNLTVNDYPFQGGDGLIWMEFTKLSWENPDGAVLEGVPRREGKVFHLPPAKRDPNLDVRSYTRKAWPQPIRSSIPGEAQKARQASERAVESAGESRAVAERVRSTVFGFGLAALIVVVLASVTAVVAVFQLISGDNGRFDSLATQVAELQQTVNAHVGRGVHGTTALGATPQQVAKLMAVTQAEQAHHDQTIWWLIILTISTLILAVALAFGIRWMWKNRAVVPSNRSNVPLT